MENKNHLTYFQTLTGQTDFIQYRQTDTLHTLNLRLKNSKFGLQSFSLSLSLYIYIYIYIYI